MYKGIVIGCDNAALDFKQAMISVLEEKKIEYIDVGIDSWNDDTVYPENAGVPNSGKKCIFGYYSWAGQVN